MLHANLMALCFIEPELLPIEVLHCGNRNFDFFAPVTYILTFTYELDPYSLEICWMCKYELPTSRLLKVIVRQTDRQTNTTEIICHNHAASWVVSNRHNEMNEMKSAMI